MSASRETKPSRLRHAVQMIRYGAVATSPGYGTAGPIASFTPSLTPANKTYAAALRVPSTATSFCRLPGWTPTCSSWRRNGFWTAGPMPPLLAAFRDRLVGLASVKW